MKTSSVFLVIISLYYIFSQELPCYCDFVRLNIDECPLDGRCRAEQDVVYSAKVTRMDDNTSETYGGMHKGQFKGRWYAHRSNLSHRSQRTRTKLATHIWNLKNQRPPVQFSISWKIVDKGYCSIQYEVFLQLIVLLQKNEIYINEATNHLFVL